MDSFEVTLFRSDGEAAVKFGSETYRITMADYERIGVADGDEVNDDVLDLLAKAAEKLACIKKALVYLSYKAQPVKVLSRKLLRAGFSVEAVEATIDLLLQRGYINESEMCIEFARVLQRAKGYGALRIKKELYAKGFEKAYITLALESLDTVSVEFLEKLLLDKFPGFDPSSLKQRNAAARYLSGLGYEFDDIHNAVWALKKE